MKKMIYLSFLVICGCSTMVGSKPASTNQVPTKTEIEDKKFERAKKATAEKTVSTDDASTLSSSAKVAFLIKYKLRKNPSSKAAIVKNLERGEEARIIKQQDEWFQVELASGGIGWCHQSAITKVNGQ